MLKSITFEQYEQLLPRLNNNPVEIGFTSNQLHLSPIHIANFESIIYPKKTTFFYNNGNDVLYFHKENIKEISSVVDEDGLSFCITFNDDLNLVFGLEEKDDEE